MDFKYPNNIFFIIIPIMLIIILYLGVRKKRDILVKLKMVLLRGEKWRVLFMVLGLSAICFSLLGPQQLLGKTSVNHDRLDIYILLDTSKSMLVQDVPPSRLEMEKQIVSGIISHLDGDRIGFIPFSSSAYIQMPLTDDYDLANIFLKVVDTDMIGGGGSNLGKAIQLAEDSFNRSSTGDKVILIISDGEEHDTNSEAVLKNINDDKLKVYTIGVGTAQGGLVPIYDDKTGQIVDYITDSNGEHVMSKLNDSTLKGLASIGNGKYYLASLNQEEVNSFLSDISTLKKTGNKTEEINNYKQLYQPFLGIGILMFLIGYLLPLRRRDL